MCFALRYGQNLGLELSPERHALRLASRSKIFLPKIFLQLTLAREADPTYLILERGAATPAAPKIGAAKRHSAQTSGSPGGRCCEALSVAPQAAVFENAILLKKATARSARDAEPSAVHRVYEAAFKRNAPMRDDE
jgi:hypothetical protein